MRKALPGFFVLILFACQPEDDLSTAEFLRLDKMLRTDSVSINWLNDKLTVIEATLDHSLSSQSVPEENWNTHVDYKWNADSSIVMIRSSKVIHGDRKQETFLVFHDTAIVKVWNEQFFDDEKRNSSGVVDPGYVLLEEIDYLTQSKRVLILRRMDFDARELADTVGLKRKKFVNHTLHDGHPDFSFEMEYIRRILNRN